MLLSKPQNDLTSDEQCMPYILQRLDKGGTLLKGPPGLEVRNPTPGYRFTIALTQNVKLRNYFLT